MNKKVDMKELDINDFEIDNILKNEFKDKDNIEVPNDIHVALQNTLKELQEKRNSHKLRKSLIAASLAGIVFIWTAFTFPAFAESLPVVGDFFKVLINNYSNKTFIDEVEKNSTNIVGKVTDNNLEITLITAVPDDSGITIGYYLKSLDDKLEMPQLWDCSVEIDGKVYEPKIDNIIHEEKDGGHYIISNLLMDNLPEKFDYKIGLKNITGINGNWSFSGSLDKTEIANQTVEKILNISRDTLIGNIEVKSVIKSPLYLTVNWIDNSINASGNKIDGNLDTRYSRYFKFVGDIPNSLNAMSAWGEQNGLKTDKYIGVPSGLKYLDVIPVEIYHGEPNVIEIDPVQSIGTIVYDGRDGNIIITDYKEDGNYKFVKARMKRNKDNEYCNLTDKLIAGDKVNEFGSVVNGVQEIIKDDSEELDDSEDFWLKYDSDKLFINGDRENGYTKEDTENIIRIEF